MREVGNASPRASSIHQFSTTQIAHVHTHVSTRDKKNARTYLLQPRDIPPQVLPMVPQVDDGVAHHLPRPVPGHLAPAVGAVELWRSVWSEGGERC